MKTMKSIQRGTLLVAALFVGLMTAGAVQAQQVTSSYCGKFTLTTPVQWRKSVLQPGEYTIRIESMSSAHLALIQKEDSAFAIRVMSGVANSYQGNSDALQLKVKNGQLVVEALVLGNFKTALFYDSSFPEQSVEEVRGEDSVRILVAKK
ncbi:MAG TPA: hypothetical protein VFI38_08360 [Candidatus Acidoferrum sp.]|nr:hypothetical protein [Candidatus Acidoferrum sp.]